jgi:indole-3-acetate monooxygenase
MLDESNDQEAVMAANPYLEVARALADEISAHAQACEAQRKMPDDLVERVRDAGLFHLTVPAALGGAECEPTQIIEVVEEVSRADASVGWNVFVGSGSGFVAWLEPGVAKELVAERPDYLMSGSFAPTATAARDGHDIVIDGRWPFSSGCQHADWFMNGVMVANDDAPPTWRFAFMRADDIEILDTWHVSGLRGTGSHDVTATGVRVPYERTIMPFSEPARFDGALYRLPFAMLLCSIISGFPLGVARRALDEFEALAQKKSHLPPPNPVMADDEYVQMTVAKTEATLRSARAYLFEVIADAYATTVHGDDISMAQRADVVMATMHAASTARAAVDTVFAMAGGSAIYEQSIMQRCARDIQAGTQHIMLSFGQWRAAGRALCGRDPESPRI